MYEGGGATEGGSDEARAARGDKCSDVAKGYTCDPNPGRGFSHAPGL